MSFNELTVYDENIALKSVISDLKKNLGEYRELSAAKDKRIADDKFILYSLEATIKELEAEIERHKNKDWDKAEVLVTLRGLESDNVALKAEIKELKGPHWTEFEGPNTDPYKELTKVESDNAALKKEIEELKESNKALKQIVENYQGWDGRLHHQVKVLREALESFKVETTRLEFDKNHPETFGKTIGYGTIDMGLRGKALKDIA